MGPTSPTSPPNSPHPTSTRRSCSCLAFLVDLRPFRSLREFLLVEAASRFEDLSEQSFNSAFGFRESRLACTRKQETWRPEQVKLQLQRSPSRLHHRDRCSSRRSPRSIRRS